MELKLRRVGTIALVALVTLGVLTGIQIGWKKFFMNDPVIVKLSSIQGVVSVDLKTENSVPVIEVQLDDIPNLKETSQQMLDVVGNARILLIDKRTPELQALLETTQFYIEEAIALGNYSELNKSVEAVATQGKLDRYAVYMDSDNIYLQFYKGGSFLYQVFSRQPGKSKIITKG